MFEGLLDGTDARRAEAVARKFIGHRVDAALTGGLALEAHLTVRNRSPRQRTLNDLDFVVSGFAAIPDSVARAFLLHHVHPLAAEGKTLMQPIDVEHGVRIDLFRAFGATLARSGRLCLATDPLAVAPAEDLCANHRSRVRSVVTRPPPRRETRGHVQTRARAR